MTILAQILHKLTMLFVNLGSVEMLFLSPDKLKLI